MFKTLSLPRTAREWQTCAANPTTAPFAKYRSPKRPPLVGACSSANLTSSAVPRPLSSGQGGVYSGWLYVAATADRKFKRRLCVLDGISFSYYASEQDYPTKRLGHHFLVALERLHFMNRGFLVVDPRNDRVWLHTDFETANFEKWYAIFRAAVLSNRLKMQQTMLEVFPPALDVPQPPPPGLVASNELTRDPGESFTGWIRIRRRLLHPRFFGREKKMYVVLSGRHFSAFKVNVEGRWVDLYGLLVNAKQIDQWIEITLDDRRVYRIAAKTDGITVNWHVRILQNLHAAMANQPSAARD